MIKKAADKVASGANKVSKRMSEEYDQFDLVLEFLQTEGFADLWMKQEYSWSTNLIEKILRQL